MNTAFAQFTAAVRGLAPRSAVVLGSGLAAATADFHERASVPFGDIPGLVPTTVHGHKGRLAVGTWGDVPVLLFGGRLHFYEGHPWDVVTGTVRAAAGLGVNRLILTNAAGGIHPSLTPGSLMAIRGHLTLLNPIAWRELVELKTPSTVPSLLRQSGPTSPPLCGGERGFTSAYSPFLLQRMLDHEAAAGRGLLAGVYAALTGPSYETPAEIRALQRIGADAVGMSTAKEAEAAHALGLEVAAVSCITNKAAGLSDGPLDHQEVLVNARLVTERLAELLSVLVSCPVG